MTKEEYAEIYDKWNKEKSFKNFIMVYKYGFTFNSVFRRPLFRVWRIIRNTLTHRYELYVKVVKGEK